MNGLTGKTVGIVGLGQIGGSIAGALRRAGTDIRIVGFDRKPDLMVEAANQNRLDVTGSGVETIERADLVILAVPVGTILDLIASEADRLRSKDLVTDVGSVMVETIEAARSAGLRNYVSGHPLAGSEKRGRDAWDSELFDKCRFFVSSSADTSDIARDLLKSLISTIGAEPVEIDPRRHDRAFALTSNLVHLLAFGMRQELESMAAENPEASRFAGPSFRSATRVAHSDPEMVYQMLWHNRKNLAEALQGFTGKMEEVRRALDEGRPEVLKRLLGLS